MSTIGDAGGPVLLTTSATVAVLRLNRPESRNAIDDELRDALIDALREVVRNPEIRALVLTGSGTAFCAGGDLAAMRERFSAPPSEIAEVGWRRQRLTHRMVLDLHRLEKITVAAVNGPAIGVGMDLALACDFVVSSGAARFAMAHLTRGLVPDGGGMYFLPRRVGLARAKELILTGRRLRPDEALALGVVDRLVADDELEQTAIDWATELTQNSPIATALTKSILDRTFQLEAEGVLALGAEAQALCYTTTAHRESVESFLDR